MGKCKARIRDPAIAPQSEICSMIVFIRYINIDYLKDQYERRIL
jgi:hypothetical protein